MGLRVVHIINGECEIFLHKDRENFVKLRVMETKSESSEESTDFEIEGYVPALQSLFSSLHTVLTHVNAISEDMN